MTDDQWPMTEGEDHEDSRLATKITTGRMTDELMADDRREDPEDSRFTTEARRHRGREERAGRSSKIPAKFPKIPEDPEAGRMADDRGEDREGSKIPPGQTKGEDREDSGRLARGLRAEAKITKVSKIPPVSW